jgi:nucleoside-diphosphate-sugar epimerase
MNKLKVVITGASGFVGAPLVEKLANFGYDVMAISRRLPADESESSVCWVEADLSSPKTYRDKVRSFCPEVIIHLAWQDIPDFSIEKSIMNQNQAIEFLSFATGLESCKKVLVSGSCWEYDRIQGECLANDVCAPKDHFTWAKHSIYSWLEMACKQKGISLGWLRVFYVYGPKQRSASLIPSILKHLKNKELPQIKTPNNANDYVFIDDVVDAFALAAKNDFSSGIYNLGAGVSTSVLEICRHAEQIVYNSSDLTQQLEEATRSSVSSVNFWANIEKIKEHLGWEPKTSLFNGITKTWDYLNTL